MAQKLLLADDSIAIQEVVEASLAKQGLQTTSVISGRSLIQKAKQIHPSIILINSILLDQDGYEVSEELRKDSELKDIPVLLLIG
jgi:PleD family two-component response regulator